MAKRRRERMSKAKKNIITLNDFLTESVMKIHRFEHKKAIPVIIGEYSFFI